MAGNFILLFSILTIFISCSEQNQASVESKHEETISTITGDTVYEIGREIRCIFQDSQNDIWFATNGEGVFKYDGKTIIQYTDKHGLPSNFVWDVQEGKDGNIWFRTNVRPADTDAICYFDGKKFITIQPDTSNLKAINYNYKENELLFDYCYDGKSLSKIQLPHTSPIQNEENKRHHYDIYSTCRDSKGNVWFGTCTAGVCKYDGKTYTWFDYKELGAAIRSIFEDKNGIIWIGNNGNGLFRYDGKNLTNFSREKNLHNYDFEKYPVGKAGMLSRVWTITDDKQGNLWAGTIDNGVWMFDGKTVRNYTTKDGLGFDAVWTIFKDSKGNLWFGTDGFGIYTFNGKSFTPFSIKK